MDNFDRLLQIVGIAIALITLLMGISAKATPVQIPKKLINFAITVVIVFILLQPRFQALLGYVIIGGMVWLFAGPFFSDKDKSDTSED